MKELKEKIDISIINNSHSTCVDKIIEEIEEIEEIEDYIFQTKNFNKPLTTLLKIPEFNYNKNFNWCPPKTHGLNNSNYIIPTYYNYHKNLDKILYNLDYFEIIKDDIRNFRKLNIYQLKYIQEQLGHHYKNELLTIYDDCVNALITSL